MAGSCEHGDEPLSSMVAGNFLISEVIVNF
jgi:hypothetical protein